VIYRLIPPTANRLYPIIGVTQTDGGGVTQTDLCGLSHTEKVVSGVDIVGIFLLI